MTVICRFFALLMKLYVCNVKPVIAHLSQADRHNKSRLHYHRRREGGVLWAREQTQHNG